MRAGALADRDAPDGMNKKNRKVFRIRIPGSFNRSHTVVHTVARTAPRMGACCYWGIIYNWRTGAPLPPRRNGAAQTGK
ncbi:MAG: hypothetical protein OXU61_08835 [Gammaproteobacteria bacterium]|nr:hypothetical protein [Gammaproteobacteria bacterium]